ncbi:MAG TPA: helix-turn-helix transcriptional regulator [Pyrinomonadaceae bacterium]|jgi:transcriptional regulator with XRE-family HTH domain|nr:helix-turn-helix transcriptional regulator [Pyrinomonadaceae bacterium]
MGGAARIKPKRLAEKLRQVREALGLSQSELLRRMGFDGVIAYHRISNYELGTGEPPLPVLLAYARLAGVSTDVLIDDELDLPAKLPARTKNS